MTAQANARDEWRAASLCEHGVLEVAATALSIANARVNHAAAEGVRYQ